MTIAIIYITLGVLYTVACVMDGQDVKPLWKRWLGKKLATVANYYYPINYCNMQNCSFYHIATRPRSRMDSGAVEMTASRGLYDTVKLSEGICITEGDELDASHRYGDKTRNILAYEARRHITNSIMKAVEQSNLVRFNVHHDEYSMRTYVKGEIEVVVK